mgnify:FL=1
MAHGVVVVGVDGSPKDERSITWAAQAATDRGAQLRIVYGFTFVGAAYGYGLPPIDVEEISATITEPLAQRARELQPNLTVTTSGIAGDPAVALVTLSREADLLVVGARGLGRLASRILGSVSQKVAAQAHCPVTVVRADSPAPLGPVTVGVDPADIIPEVIEFGFAEAGHRGLGVRLLSAFSPAADEIGDAQVQRLLGHAAQERSKEMDALGEQWQARYPDVPAEVTVLHTDPVDALAAGAEEAAMLVLGSRGRRGLTGRRLGSVAQGVLHVAPLVTVLPIQA